VAITAIDNNIDVMPPLFPHFARKSMQLNLQHTPKEQGISRGLGELKSEKHFN